MGGPDLLCVGSGKGAQDILKRMEREATFSYQTLTLPEDSAANVLYLNGTLVHRSLEDIPRSFKVNFVSNALNCQGDYFYITVVPKAQS